MLDCIYKTLWQPYRTFNVEEGDDDQILSDKLSTLGGFRSNCQTLSYCYCLLSPCCIFGALVIITAIGMSGILPGATTGWLLAGLGGGILDANILMGNIKNRLACCSNYAVIGIAIITLGIMGGLGVLPILSIGTAVLVIWFVGNCYGSYFCFSNMMGQGICNAKVVQKLNKAKQHGDTNPDVNAKMEALYKSPQGMYVLQMMRPFKRN